MSVPIKAEMLWAAEQSAWRVEGRARHSAHAEQGEEEDDEDAREVEAGCEENEEDEERPGDGPADVLGRRALER